MSATRPTTPSGSTAPSCAPRCVGEGGNLGLTQLGRIEYARAGGRINTDFIDNSAGVDTSDHEVNIKILLDRVVADGDLTDKQRNALLATMTDEVADLVLADNYRAEHGAGQRLRGAPSLLHVHADWMRRLERAGRLDRELEFLPTSEGVRAAARPRARGSPRPSWPCCSPTPRSCWPTSCSDTDAARRPVPALAAVRATSRRRCGERFRDRMDAHPLRREIIATQRGQPSWSTGRHHVLPPAVRSRPARPAEELARAHVAARAIFGADEVFGQIARLDNQVDAAVQTRMRLETRTLVERATRWLVQQPLAPIDIAATDRVVRTGYAPS